MANKVITVRDVWNYFHYRQVTGDDSSLDRQIYDSSTNRPGLELAGFFPAKPYRRIVLIGQKERTYIDTMSEDRQRVAFDYLTNQNVPMILISRDASVPNVLLEIARKKNFPVFTSYAPTSSLTVELVSFLEEFFVPYESVHGVLMQIYGKGVLITGSSGIGKSEIALELLKKGHYLVADDRVDICRVHNKIRGEAPEILKSMIELRGVGIINVNSMFGVTTTLDQSIVDYVIDLQKLHEEVEFDRIGGTERQTVTYFGVDIPKLVIPVSEGRSVAVIIEAAVSNMILLSKGYDSADEIEKRVVNLINQQKGGK